ncbi:protein GP45.2 [Proteus phage phiP4-3]|uniref:Uncharacterized protein n=1 Tax=Proteus phage phiP4-3 TaxID=2065203 RepID=A0A2I6PFS1_9CAUD|nr:protein GP45.2 [Proteus phage phiP4-3]AUM58578.1 hypothetical protein phiP43_220 [Proteus phage phiP4-3]AZV01182.1 hypothetical protein vBSdyM006_045 [Shigella phage vB_SdyM_006]
MRLFTDLETYPEIKKYYLCNRYSDDIILVTKQQLEEKFGDELPKIMNNRHNYWTVEDVYD